MTILSHLLYPFPPRPHNTLPLHKSQVGLLNNIDIFAFICLFFLLEIYVFTTANLEIEKKHS